MASDPCRCSQKAMAMGILYMVGVADFWVAPAPHGSVTTTRGTTLLRAAQPDGFRSSIARKQRRLIGAVPGPRAWDQESPIHPASGPASSTSLATYYLLHGHGTREWKAIALHCTRSNATGPTQQPPGERKEQQWTPHPRGLPQLSP